MDFFQLGRQFIDEFIFFCQQFLETCVQFVLLKQLTHMLLPFNHFSKSLFDSVDFNCLCIDAVLQIDYFLSRVCGSKFDYQVFKFFDPCD